MNTTALCNELEPFDLSSCIVHHRGEIVFHYEKLNHASSQLIPVNSCTKSILSSLICIAMDQGLLPQPSTLITQFFPQLKDDPDERKHRISLENLLTLTAGFQWNEFGGLNSFPKMTSSANWIDFVLQQPMSDEPGTKMNYNSGVSQMLAAILVQATESSLAQFAERNLFGPLAIKQYDWKADPQGVHTGGYGLQLCAYDMLKFGLLYLHNGVWSNDVLISRKMLELSTTAAIAATPPERGFYSWHWWNDCLPPNKEEHRLPFGELHYYYARGFGGQFIIIVPSLEAVVVLTRKPRKKGLSPLDLFRQSIAPLLITEHYAL